MPLVLVVFALLLLATLVGDWYAGLVSLPRYCQQPELALQRLAAQHAAHSSVGMAARRDYIVAAKLEFLVPRKSDEPLETYVRRVRRQIEQRCH